MWFVTLRAMNVLLAASVIAVAIAIAWRFRSMPRSLRIAFVVGTALLAGYTFTRPLGLFSGDEGIKLVQTMSLGDGQVAMIYPGSDVDPSRAVFPYRAPFTVVQGGERYGVYAITFTGPSLIGWTLAGQWGLHLLPIAGGMLVLWYLLALAWRVFEDERWALACGAVLFTTPVVLNAALFNEHAISAGLFALAIERSSRTNPSRRSLFVCGAALGLAVTMRLELLGAMPAVGVFVAIVSETREGGWSGKEARRRLTWIALGGLPPAILYVAVNLATIGAPVPMMHRDYADKSFEQYKDDLEPRDFWEITGGIGSSLLLWPLGLSLLAFRKRALEVTRQVVIVALIGVWTYACIIYLYELKMPERLAGTLFLATPLFAVGLATGPHREPATRQPSKHRGCVAGESRLPAALWCLAVAGTASLLIFYPVGGGLRLGPRYLLPMIAIWVIVSLVAARRSRWFAAAAVVTALVGIWSQWKNHELGMDVRVRNAVFVEDAARLPHRYVFSDAFWGKQVLAPLYQDKVILSAPKSQTPNVLNAIRARGETGAIEMLGGLQSFWWIVKAEPGAGNSGRVKSYRFVTR